MKEEFTVCVLSRADLEALGYDPNSLSDSDMERVASKMGDAYVGNGFWVDLGICLEHYGAAKLKSFDGHFVFEQMFEDGYDNLRNKFGYLSQDIDVDELYNTGKTIWQTGTGDYCFEYESDNVIKIRIYKCGDSDNYCESCAYEEGDFSLAFATVLANILRDYVREYLKENEE